ncbi:hypothetical protein D1Y85_14360 [Paraburkholderia dinghuensis]|uniref:Uncharacterized protein n=2 Tax=Paraburkholderia dinghuensis TaxID=2305225 RepID=A0A3N6N535_9BURK|nr:hypothetical protein D1Y85_14360 [Paraburkholderia dinghuensis]
MTCPIVSMLKRLLCIIGFAGLMAACSHDGPDNLVGTWGESIQGQIYPVLKIEKTSGRYVLYTNANGHWYRASEYMYVATKADLEQLLHRPVRSSVTGLKGGVAAVFMVPAGWVEGTFATHTGFFAVTWFGPIELIRI